MKYSTFFAIFAFAQAACPWDPANDKVVQSCQICYKGMQDNPAGQLGLLSHT